MARINFFERMEREIDFQFEYKKIENIILNEHSMRSLSLNDIISRDFRNWKGRGNFLSFEELRKYLGFTYSEDPRITGGQVILRKTYRKRNTHY